MTDSADGAHFDAPDNGSAAESAFVFHGNWREFAPIAFTNLLLTIVTLGIYRFWATTRERQYLWSQTQFIDERIEWTGTGKELFFGFLIVLLGLGLPFFFLQFGVQALAAQGYPEIAGRIGFAVLFLIIYLGGVAQFRGLRYRLSRTYWHGIRGGSDDGGFGYGWSSMWKNFVGMLPLGLMIPWSMASLWNERWNAMSFGPHRFTAHLSAEDIFARFLLFYLIPVALFIFALFAGFGAVTMGISNIESLGPDRIGIAMAIVAFLFILLFYGALGLIAMAFYAKYFRAGVEALTLHTLDFRFSARTMDWIKLFIVDMLLVIGTLGIGYIFLGYRHWKFFITHMEAFGEINLDQLTQSTTTRSKHGEGLLDAFDVGAI